MFHALHDRSTGYCTPSAFRAAAIEYSYQFITLSSCKDIASGHASAITTLSIEACEGM